MATLRDVMAIALLCAGALFFVAGTVGLIRFPDLPSRLHAVTKADGLGLGLVVAGLVVSAPSAVVAVKLVLIWGIALTGSTVACHLIAAQHVEAAGGEIAVERHDDP
jgi:multicomponent Na+:H+ antiporter subunit G